MPEYETFLDRMRAENPGSWPEPAEDMPFNPAATTQAPITDDEACSGIAVDDQHVMTVTGHCRGRTARMDMTEREVHVTARLSNGETTRATVPLGKVMTGRMAVTRYTHSLELTFQIDGAELMDRPSHETIKFDGPEDMSQALDFIERLGSRIIARNPHGLN